MTKFGRLGFPLQRMFRTTPLPALALYALFAVVLFPHVKWYVDNPDTFQYLAIAHRYADGSFLNIVNAYWSPLIIWLLVLPIKVVGNGIIAFKLLQLLIGGATLIAWNALLLAHTRRWRILLVFTAIPFILAYALLFLTPDLLFLCFALYVLRFSIHGDLFSSTRNAILFGITGGAWYFSKAFAFPLFVSLLIFLFLIDKGPIGPRTRNVSIAFVSFLLVIAPWVLAMSLKYDHFTISEAARFNQTVEVAPMPGEIKELPLLKDGPHEPPPCAISPWEAPGDVIRLTPLRPWTDPQRYARLLQRNFASIYYHDIQRQLGTPFLVVAILAWIVLGAKRFFFDRAIAVPLFMLLALNLGYAAVLVHDRYIWLNAFIMLFMICICVQKLLLARPRQAAVLMFAICVFAIKRPVKQILFTRDADVPGRSLLASIADPIGTLRHTYHIDHERVRAIEVLRPLDLQGALASLRSSDPERDAYSSCLHIAYELGLTYHGEILPDLSQEEQLQQLHEHKIRYFAVWHGMPWHTGSIILDRDPPAPRIYQFDRELSDR